MEGKNNWSAVSVVCVIQCVLCAVVVLVILCWQLIGGSAYEAARDWYRDNAGNTVLVYPVESGAAETSSDD